jgi:hypothetical protein
MMSLVVGDPPEELPFDALGVDGQPISSFAAQSQSETVPSPRSKVSVFAHARRERLA